MNKPLRRVGAVMISGAVAIMVGGIGRADDPPAQQGRASGQFIRVKNHVFNVDAIRYVVTEDERTRVYRIGDQLPIELASEDFETLASALCPATTGHTAEAGAERFQFLAHDSFDGTLGLNWKPVRYDPSHVSLTRNPSKLTITTQRGTIHGEESNDPLGEGIKAKNLFVIDYPLAKEADLVVTTCVDGFTPEAAYQQAGLIVYNDDDNYLKWGYEYNWQAGEGQVFCCVTETNAQPEHHFGETTSGLKRYWLRLKKRGNRYEYSTSTDGKDYRVSGEVEWGDGSPRMIGLLAKNGGNKEAGELDVPFEYFDLRASAPTIPK